MLTNECPQSLPPLTNMHAGVCVRWTPPPLPLQQRLRQRKKPVAKGARNSSAGGTRQNRGKASGVSVSGVKKGGGDGGGGGEGIGGRRRRTERETKKRSEERSKKVSDAKNADKEWKKAMTLIQYLD